MEQIAENVHGSGRICLALHPSNNYLYVGGSEGVIKQFSYGLQGKSLSLASVLSEPDQCHDEAIHEICWNAAGDRFALCCEDGEVVLLRHPSCSVQSTLGRYDSSASSISFDLSSKYSFLLAMSSEAGRVKIVNALDATSKFFEFECSADGVRHIRFVPYKPDPLRASREKFLAVAQCDGSLSLWKVLTLNVFEETRDAEEKVVREKCFHGVFPKIKGGDANQRLDFDSTHDGALMALPGHTVVKLLDTRAMQMAKTETIVHEANTNCCAFKPKGGVETDIEGSYTLAVSDVKGKVSVWSVKLGATGSVECTSIERIVVGEPVCNLVWRGDELIASTMYGNLYKHTLRGAGDGDKENVDSNVGGMDVDDAAEEKAPPTEAEAAASAEPATAEPTEPIAVKAESKKTGSKSKFEEDSDEDFDIDMDDAASTGKKILLKKAEESESPTPSPVPAAVSAQTNPESTAHTFTTAATQSEDQSSKTKIADELAAAADMFGDDDEDFGADLKFSAAERINTDPEPVAQMKAEYKSKPVPKPVSFSKTSTTDSMDQDIDDEEVDNGSDLGDFIVNDAPKSNDAPMMDNADDPPPLNDDEAMVQHWTAGPRQRPFVNGETDFDDDGQRYLMLCEIGGLIVRKQNASTNPMEMNILTSLNNRRYVYELDVFDKSKYSRAVAIKSDHHFVCAAVNAHGLLLGSQCDQPINDEQVENDDDIVDSVVRYKPILRREEYRSFASDKDQEWTHRLPIGEECVACALTSNFVLIASNQHFLRVLTIGGLQAKPVLCFPRGIAHIAGSSDSNIAAVLFEDLSMCVLDLDTNTNLWEGHCAVTSPDACVTRLYVSGNAQNFKIVSIDSENCVSWLDRGMFNGAAWTVILDINEHLKNVNSKADSVPPKGIWPVFFDAEEQNLMVLELALVDHPLPSQSSGNGGLVLVSYSLAVPLMGVGADEVDPATDAKLVTFGSREQTIMTDAIRRKMSMGARVTEKMKKTASKQKLKDYLMLFGHACATNKTVVAYDIAAHFLDTEKAMSSAIKAAMRCQLPMLAEQLTSLAKERLAQREEKEATKVLVSPETVGKVTASRSIRKPSRTTVGRLQRPTAKLGASRKTSDVNEVTHGVQRTQLIGKKRAGNPCGADPSHEPPKKRGHTAPSNPFSCGGKEKATNQRQKQKSKNSVFSSAFN